MAVKLCPSRAAVIMLSPEGLRRNRARRLFVWRHMNALWFALAIIVLSIVAILISVGYLIYHLGEVRGVTEILQHPPKERLDVKSLVVGWWIFKITIVKPFEYVPPQPEEDEYSLNGEPQIEKLPAGLIGKRRGRPLGFNKKTLIDHGFKNADDLQAWLKTVREDMSKGISLQTLCDEHKPPIPRSTADDWLKKTP